MLLDILCASLLGNILLSAGEKGTTRGREQLETLPRVASMLGRGTVIEGKGTIGAGQDF